MLTQRGQTDLRCSLSAAFQRLHGGGELNVSVSGADIVQQPKLGFFEQLLKPEQN